MDFKLENAKHALICGAGHGIGFELVNNILTNYPHINVIATFRSYEKASLLLDLEKSHPDRLTSVKVDLTNEEDLKKLVVKLQDESSFKYLSMCIVCSGVLHSQTLNPEKSLKEINKQNLLNYFSNNSISFVLVAKYLTKFFSKETPSLLGALSAKVGSISDNKLGGWYGYRASKSALNMFVKNISIEYSRMNIKTIVVALHPGTTNTQLSQPFLKNVTHDIWLPRETAEHLLAVVNGLEVSKTGSFFSWDGSEIGW